VQLTSNFVACAFVCTWLALIILKPGALAVPGLLIEQSGRRTSVWWVLFFSLMRWLSLLLTYYVISHTTTPVPFFLLLVSDVGNILSFASALAYCRGDAFDLKDLVPLSCVAVVVVIVATLSRSLVPGMGGLVISIGPSVVFSAVAMVAIGWAVVVRCGWTAYPFLLLMCFYAALQVPAFFEVFVLGSSMPTDHPGVDDLERIFKLTPVFSLLASLKVVEALSFLGFVLSPEHDLEQLRKPKDWPSNQDHVPMHPSYLALLKWGLSLVASFVLGLLWQRF
jgi:hypothetical protein